VKNVATWSFTRIPSSQPNKNVVKMAQAQLPKELSLAVVVCGAVISCGTW
jgi:hypothetical protein